MEKRYIYIPALVISIVFLLCFSAWAVPGLINFQGKLTNTDGVSLNGIYIIKFQLLSFKIY